MAEPKNGTEEWKGNIDKAKEHFRQGLKELAQAADSAKTQGTDAWEKAQERAQEAWEEAREKGMASWQSTRERSEEIWEDTSRLVRKHPSRAIGIAALIGIVFGLLLSSRDRD